MLCVIIAMIGAQIVELLDQNMTPGQVAEALGVSEVTVKAASAGTETPALDFSDDDLAAAIEGIGQVARYGENERNRVQCAMFVYEVKKGLRTSKNNDKQLPVAQINQLIINANADIARFAARKSNGRGDCLTIAGVQDAQEADCGAPDSTAPQEIRGGDSSRAVKIQSGQETTAGSLSSL